MNRSQVDLSGWGRQSHKANGGNNVQVPDG